ncbi:thioredoxin-like protein [Trichoderma novae-zelandiae]
MPVELRKRKAPVAPPAPAPSRKKAATSKAKKPAAGKAKDEVKKPEAKGDKPPKDDEATDTAPESAEEKETVKETKEAAKEEPKDDKKKPAAAGKIAVGDVVDLEGFGGEVQTNDGDKTTLKKLVDDSKSGVVLFTYPKASTPGCTTQVCLFRDSYEPLTADGLAIYGLSTDSPKANTTFKEKQKLPYPLLCDPQATLIGAIGLKKQPKGTQRGVFVIDKEGKVLVAEAGGPAATADRVKALVEELKGKN